MDARYDIGLKKFYAMRGYINLSYMTKCRLISTGLTNSLQKTQSPVILCFLKISICLTAYNGNDVGIFH